MDKLILCAIAKCENKYIMEWIGYHFRLGFDKIVIYDNNDENGERIRDVVGNLQNAEIIDWTSHKQRSCEAQVAAYNDCYKKYMDWNWMMFLDIDEFLEFKNFKTIKEYLDQDWVKSANCIKFHWKCYSDNEYIYSQDGLVTEKYTQLCENKSVNEYVKTIYKCGFPNLKILNVHYSSPITNVYYQNGKKAPYKHQTIDENINYDSGWIRHYVTKSMEEFVTIKYKRRGPGVSKNRLNGDFYFKYNKKTPEKERQLKSFINKLENKIPYTPTNISNTTMSLPKSLQPYYASKAIPKKNITTKPVVTKKEEQNQTNDYPFGISICISAWKTTEYIEECLDSIANQTWFKDHDNWEILLGIDGCEETLAKVKEIMCKYKNLKVMMMDHNVGTYVTCNTIMNEAEYEWLLRFDSDDIMPNDMIFKIFSKDLKNIDVIKYEHHDFGNGNHTGIAWGSHMVKHDVFKKFGGYRNWRISADFDFLYRIEPKIKTLNCNDVFYNRRVRDNGLEYSIETDMKSELRQTLNDFVKTKSRLSDVILMTTEKYNIIFNSIAQSFYKKYNGEKTIISLTTWKRRIDYAHETINSLLKHCNNSHIVLVLSSEEFPEKEKNLPQTLKKISNNIEILWVYKNTKAFKKVMPTMEKYKNVPIVSADDDIIYLYDYATELYNLYINHKDCATISYRHSRMVTNCGAATLYNPKFYSVFINSFNRGISDIVLEDDMFIQYVIDKNKLKQHFKENTFPFRSNEQNSISPLSALYKNEKNPQERKKDSYKKINSTLDSEIVVNITTWKKRDLYLYKMLENLKKQTLYPDRIVLWLAEEEYDKNNLPETIKKCINEKLVTELKWVKENTKGHKRYDCFKYFNNCYNLLLDDDILYKPDFIKELVEASKKHQNCITVYSSRCVDYVGYKVQESLYCKDPSHKNQFIAGRCCFPPYIFPFEAYENESMRNEYVLNCDESWYRSFFIKNDIKIYVMHQWDNSQYPTIDGTQVVSLWNINRQCLDNDMRDKERNFYNAIKISHMESECKKIWPGMKIDEWTLQK